MPKNIRLSTLGIVVIVVITIPRGYRSEQVKYYYQFVTWFLSELSFIYLEISFTSPLFNDT